MKPRSGTREDGQSLSDINMTPLIDVMLVLLIIFIITLPMQTDAVKIDTPFPDVNPPVSKPAVIDLAIDFDGMLQWNGQPVTRVKLQNYISQDAAKIPQPEVHITVDKFAHYAIVAQTLADLQSRGMKAVGFVNASPL